MDKYIGKKLEGRYELLELIGFGGMAIVFKAHDILENKNVAIKILKDEYLSNEDFKRRFRNESKAIAVLSHPSIVKIFDVNFSDNIQYIVMEYIDGITLKEYIEQQGSINWKEAVHFTVQILRALQHAHDNGIVHRDVKPQNVMLLEDGTIKVMDFGIARFARENGKTLSDKAIGSVHYISPEQAKGDTTDEKTDIYAVGVIMYEMLTGKVPFDGETPVSIAIKQMQIEPERPRAINPEIPVGLEEIILRAMQKDPQLRYQTASEMLRDIDEFKRNPSVVFEYKYFNRDGTTKYFTKIDAKTATGGATIMREETVKKSYTMNILAGVTAACVLVAIVALFFFFNGLGNKPKDVIMPNVVGLTVEAAQQKATDLKVVTVEQKLSAEFDKGIIIEQKPEKGTSVKINSEIKVIVSLGLQAIVVPDLVNEEVAVAKQKLVDLGLDVEQVNKTDQIITSGHVISTEPQADTEMQKGDTVVLYVSVGAPEMPTVVPDIRGLTKTEANNRLAPYGLMLGNVTPVDSAEKEGIIVAQTPLNGERVEKGSKINVEISNGVQPQKKVNIAINFPTGSTVDHDVSFAIYVNNQSFSVKNINPTTTKTLSIDLEVINGMINGIVSEVEGLNDVSIMLDDRVFATYTVDFKTGTATNTQPPDYSLLYPEGIGGDSDF